MSPKLKGFVFSFLFFTACTFPSSATVASLDLPPDIRELFRTAGVDESGYFGTGGDTQKLQAYVLLHWRDLLDHYEELPGGSPDNPGAKISMLGGAAEALSPVEYLKFLNHYLDLYAQRRIADQFLDFQLATQNQKRRFLEVNYTDSGVQAFLLRAKDLVPKHNTKLQEELDSYLSGEDSENYILSDLDTNPGPQTLPGVHLPFLFERFVRRTIPWLLLAILLVRLIRKQRREGLSKPSENLSAATMPPRA
jgi:hypothetical protein